jgi:CRP-like cAMP-binding protein
MAQDPGLDALTGVRLFAGLSEAELAELLSASKVASAKPGQVLVQEGAHSGRLCVVLQGTCEVRKGGGEQARAVSALSEKDVFGEVGLVAPDARASASVVATMPVQLLTWDRDLFRQRVHGGSNAFRKVLGNVAEVLGARLSEMLGRWTRLFEAFERAAPREAHDVEIDEIREHFLRAFTA